MTDTLFPAEGSDVRTHRSDPLEPLSRLEDQLRRSRERLVEGDGHRAHPEDAVPAVLAPADPPGPTGDLPDEAPRIPATSPYAALAELTPVHDFSLEAEPPTPTASAPEVGGTMRPGWSAWEASEADLGFEIPEIVIEPIEAPADVLAPLRLAADPPTVPMSAQAPVASVEPVVEEDDVWQPFPEMRADLAPDAEPAVAHEHRDPAADETFEQDPLPVPAHVVARSASPAVAGDADRALAEAAREVSWLARRVADSLESVTGRLDGFERRFAELSDRPADAVPAAPASMGQDATALEEWSMALARLMRSDSNALRDEVHRIAEEQGVALAEVHRLTEENGARISASVEETIARIDRAVLRLADAVEERLGSAVASLEAAADAMRSEDQEALVRIIDDRMEALARLVRSDNERISARLEAEIGIGREVLRAAKELQASLANDVASALDQRDRMFRASGSGSR